MPLETGQAAPDFTAPATDLGDITLSDFKGRNVVLYFYPKDDTSGCTTEALGFTAAKADFEAANTVVIGVSKDTMAKHEKFTAKHSLGIPLVSDEDGSICEAYGTWVEKKMYGKTYMGIERATFLINAEGDLVQIWRKVRVKGHVEAVLEAVDAL